MRTRDIMKMHDFCRSIGLFLGRKSKEDGDKERRSKKDGPSGKGTSSRRRSYEGEAAVPRPASPSPSGCLQVRRARLAEEEEVTDPSPLVQRRFGVLSSGRQELPSATSPSSPPQFYRILPSTKLARHGSLRSFGSGRSKHSQTSGDVTSKSSQAFNGDRAFYLSVSPDQTTSSREVRKGDSTGADIEDSATDVHTCPRPSDDPLGLARCPERWTPGPDRRLTVAGEDNSKRCTVTKVIDSSTAQNGDISANEMAGKKPQGLSCIERNRFLEKNYVVRHAPESNRPTGRESERGKREENNQRSNNHHHHHHRNHNQGQHHHHGQHRHHHTQNQAPHRHRPTRTASVRGTSSTGYTASASAGAPLTSTDRRRTLGSIDAKEVKMLARASKALQDHMKDMTEKTKTTCCVVPNNKLAEKENLIIQNQHHHVSGLPNEPHAYITDHSRGTVFVRGKLLGKGGFAKCYELTDIQTGKCYAGKIISKNRLAKPHQREKIVREVELHRHLNSPHVVGFHSYFEDSDNVYIVLENCSRKSLVHVLKSRKTVTEPEVRYYLRQLVDGCRYIHNQKIIHRDLKLGNMLLNENMSVKIADFGLATRVEYEGEKKMTVCGTPNYIAPEVLQKKGHSYEADIWAMGCVMYALLVGRPPFETPTLKETYMRITANKYSIPSHLSSSARSLIQALLAGDPAQRPSLDKILQHDFFSAGYSPTSLPTSCCDSAPKFPPPGVSHHHQQHHQQPPPQQQQQQQQQQQVARDQQRPKSYAAPVSATEAMQKITSSLAQLRPTQGPPMHCADRSRARSLSPVARHKSPGARAVPATTTTAAAAAAASAALPASAAVVIATRNPPSSAVGRPSSTGSSTGSETSSSYGSRSSRPSSTDMLKALPVGSSIRLYQLLASCLEQMPADSSPSAVHNVKPLWVTKWVDYSNKYGFGFQLSDRSVGVLFNDTTRMLLSPDGTLIYYNDLSNKVYCFPSSAPPRDYEKKATLLKYFAQYMDEHLIHGGDLLSAGSAGAVSTNGGRMTEIAAGSGSGIFMKKWFRTGKAIVLYLNNGTLQVNFFEDHTKVILSPDGQDYLVTYINSHRQAVSYRLLQFRHFGCSADIQSRLQYARNMLQSIINIEGEAV